MMDGFSGEVRAEMKLVYRQIEGILDRLRETGLEIMDSTGQPYDEGLPLKVVSTQPMPGVAQAQIIETIRPTIHWQNQVIQTGEVVVGTPVPAGEPRLKLVNPDAANSPPQPG